MAVAVDVCGCVAVAMAGLTKKIILSHEKSFLNQCLGLEEYGLLELLVLYIVEAASLYKPKTKNYC